MKFTCSDGRVRQIKRPNKYSIDWEAASRSKIQKKVKDLLYPFWMGDLVFEELPLVGTRMTFDFFNASREILLEVDGRQHSTYVKHFHKNRENFLQQIKRDVKKDEFAEINNLTLFRINEGETINLELLNEIGIINT